MSYNPLHTKIQIGNKYDHPSTFEKKRQVQVIDEGSNRSIPQQPTQPQSQRSIAEPPKSDIEQLINNPAFYRNLMKYNSRMVADLSVEVHRELFETNKDYLKKLTETYMSQQMRREMMDFKISFADFLKDFLKKQLNVSMQSADVEALRRDIDALKSNSLAFNQSMNEDRSVMMDQQFRELKSEIGELKNTINEIKAGETRLEQKLDNTLADINRDSRGSLISLDNHKLALQRIEDQEAIIKLLKDELGNNKNKIKDLESQVDFKLAALEQMVQRQQLDYSASITQFHDEGNHFFNKEEVSFSIIQPKKGGVDETQLLDVKELNNYMGAGLLKRHTDFITPDRPASPKKAPITINLDDYNPNPKQPVIADYGSKEDIGALANQHGFMKSDEYPRRTTQSPYTPEMVGRKPVKLNESITGRFKVSKQNLESSLVDITLNNNTIEEILIDEHGFVVDHNGFPILDAKGNLIKLNNDNIQNLKVSQKNTD